jgi:hypothetical protein
VEGQENTEEKVPEPEITGLCRIDKEYEELQANKYKKLRKDTDAAIEEDPTQFKINA